MKLSEKRRGALYAAICKPIMDLRAKHTSHSTGGLNRPIHTDENAMRLLERTIWTRVLDALGAGEMP